MNFTTSHGSEFSKLLNELGGYARNQRDSFDDFLELAFCSMSQAVHVLRHGKQCEETEARYMRTVPKVKDIHTAPKLLGHLAMGLEMQPHDFLGEIYMVNEMGNKNSGQFFTPYSISQVLSGVTFKDITPKPDGGRYTINDPACGSGSTLIAACEQLKENGFKQNQFFICGEDIDLRCCKMIYLHLSLLDIPARITHRNTLSMEEWGSWETIGYASNPFPKPDFRSMETIQKELLGEFF